MVDYISRAAWGARQSEGGVALVASAVVNTAFHWPGMSKAIDATGTTGFQRVCSALRGWQRYHMDTRGWSDIAYQIAIDQAGRAYILRGINVRSGANGDATVNKIYGAVLLVLGPGEQPSAQMQATAKQVMHDYNVRFPRMPARPTWHGKIRPGGGTDCPGTAAIAAINAGKFDEAVPAPIPVPPNPNTGPEIHMGRIRNLANGWNPGAVTSPAYREGVTFLAWAAAVTKKGGYPLLNATGLDTWKRAITQKQFAAAGTFFKQVIINVQKRWGLKPDGVFGPQTAAILAKYNYQIKP